jgi:hypothetical protein
MAAMSLDRSSARPEVLGEDAGVLLIAQTLHEVGGTFDISKEEGDRPGR